MSEEHKHQTDTKPSAKKTKTKAGRPSTYSETLAAEICGLIGSGMSLNQICKMDSMPAQSSVYLWLSKHEQFSEMYTRAREDQADTLADQIIDIADEQPPNDDNGRTDGGWVTWQRNRVEARKWTAAKLKPRKYGDKVGVEAQGGFTLNVVTGVPEE